MHIVDSGVIYDGASAPSYGRRSIRRTTVCGTSDGTLYVSFRRGTSHESIDGHPVTFASTDEGITWDFRYDGYGEGKLDDIPGQVMSLSLYEIKPGMLMGTSLWIDHTDPALPFMNPETEGLLPEKIFHVISADGARTWGPRRVMDIQPHVAGSPCANHVFTLSNGDLAQPYETLKEWDDTSPTDPRAYLRLSHDQGKTWPDWVEMAANSQANTYYWDQRLALHAGDGRIVAMFWTHDALTGKDKDVHISWGTPDAKRWTIPSSTGLPGQHCQPVVVRDETVVAIYADRIRPGIVASVSNDFGRTWDRDRDLLLYGSPAGTEPGVGQNMGMAGQWNTMVKYRFGHPRAIMLPSGEVFAVWYGGDDYTKQALWAKIALD